MEKGFEQVRRNVKFAEKALVIKNDPAVNAIVSLLKLTPGIGEYLDSALNEVLYRNQEKKRDELLEYIINGNKNITFEKVNDIEFIMNFAKTTEAVDRLSENNKIQYMGRLLRRGYFSNEKIINYQFDEFLSVIKDLSYREIEFLVIYDKFMGKVEKPVRNIYECDNFIEFKKEIKIRFGTSDNIIIDMLNRLQSKGLCFFEIASDYASEGEYKTFTSEYFKELKKYIY
jgi:hypothetical protein